MHKLLTLDDLHQYCLQNNLFSFTAQNDDEAIVVTVPATYADGSDDDDRAVFLNIKACHTLKNRNKSSISDDVMKKALDSFKLTPILASIVETTDEDGNTTLDFNGHDMTIEQDKMNPDEERVRYIEQIVGVVSPDNIYMEKEKNSDKQYVYATGIVYKEYTYAADILAKRKDVDVSVELAVKDFSYNAKDKTLVINDFKFTGICLLGSKVKPGMAGAHASIEDFSLKSSMEDVYEEGHKLVQEFADVVSKFKEWYSETTKEGENTNKFDQLLEKYGKTAEDIDFEYEGLSDEELEAKFAEVFEDEKEDVADNDNGNVDDDIDGNSDDNQDDNTDDNADDDNADVGVDFKKKRKCSIEINGEMHEFELSLQDTIDALYQLVNSTYGAEDNTWYSVTVYEDHVIMHDYWSGLHYSQKYSVTDDVYSLDGEREQVFAEFLTSTELESLKEMRATYEALKTFKANVEAAELHSQREAILADERYSIMKDDRKYRALCKNMDNYSLDELTKEVKALHSDYVSEHADSFNFSADEKKHRAKVAYGITFEQEDKPYASLF